MTKEKHRTVLHKRHGWLEAPEGWWFEESENRKSYWLCSDQEPTFSDHFPYGTRFNATSILAVSD
jgi:hypothetical protein